MRPAALILNILVASIGTIRFYRAGCFSWSLFWPFALGAIPFAFVGGSLTLPSHIYKQVVGVILLFAAYRLIRKPIGDTHKPVAIPLALLCGAGIGLLSGLTGTGGGIFLSPLLLFAGWAKTKQTAGVSVAFILVNSIAGVAGMLTKGSDATSATLVMDRRSYCGRTRWGRVRQPAVSQSDIAAAVGRCTDYRRVKIDPDLASAITSNENAPHSTISEAGANESRGRLQFVICSFMVTKADGEVDQRSFRDP